MFLWKSASSQRILIEKGRRIRKCSRKCSKITLDSGSGRSNYAAHNFRFLTNSTCSAHNIWNLTLNEDEERVRCLFYSLYAVVCLYAAHVTKVLAERPNINFHLTWHISSFYLRFSRRWLLRGITSTVVGATFAFPIPKEAKPNAAKRFSSAESRKMWPKPISKIISPNLAM